MKKINFSLSFLFCFLFTSPLFAQINIGKVNSLNEVIGQEVFMYSAHKDFYSQLIKNSKVRKEDDFVKAKKFNIVDTIFNDNLLVLPFITINGDNYYGFKLSNGLDFYFPVEYENLICQQLISLDALNKQLEKYRIRYAYLFLNGYQLSSYYLSINFNERTFDGYRYAQMNWIGYDRKSLSNRKLLWKLHGASTYDEYCLSEGDIHDLNSKSLLLSDSTVNALEILHQQRRKKAVEDSLAKAKQDSIFMTHMKLVVLTRDETSYSPFTSDTAYFSRGDTVPVYSFHPMANSFTGGEFYVIKHGAVFTINRGAIKHNDDPHLSYLQKISKKESSDWGKNIRYQEAKEWDSIQTVALIERTFRMLKIIDSIQTDMVKKEVFLITYDYSYSEYQFGIKFKFFNCWKKSIKYIDMTISAYNQVNDLQRDDIGRNQQKIHCIGPIESREYGTFDFDELFWDDNDIIKYLRITSVKITFMDNTIKTFSGWNNIKKHILHSDN